MGGDTARKHLGVVDGALILAIAVLFGDILAQSWGLGQTYWQHWPRPGRQVYQQYVEEVGEGANAREVGARYLFYLPPDYEPSHSWPMVVFLHGSGERGTDLEQVRHVGPPKRVEEGERFGFVLVSPQCPADSGWDSEAVVALVDNLATTWAIDRGRIYLTGFSMGGYGTWQTACLAPERFAAIAPLAGGGDPAQAGQLAQLPIWAFHGADDQTVPLEESQKMVDAVRAAGGHVRLTVYDRQGHGIDDRTYAQPEFWDWLLAQRRESGRGEGLSAGCCRYSDGAMSVLNKSE